MEAIGGAVIGIMWHIAVLTNGPQVHTTQNGPPRMRQGSDELARRAAERAGAKRGAQRGRVVRYFGMTFRLWAGRGSDQNRFANSRQESICGQLCQFVRKRRDENGPERRLRKVEADQQTERYGEGPRRQRGCDKG